MRLRFVILFICFLHMNSVVGQFEVQFSEPLALFEFVTHITPNSYPNAYKEVFDSSKYNNEKYRSVLDKFQLVKYIYWYPYTQYPYGNKVEGGTYFLLNKNLIESRSIKEFEKRSIGIIPNADLWTMARTLDTFLPLYRELILKPNEASMKKQIALLQKKIKETDIRSMVDKIKKFHNSSWNSAQPFVLNVCPTKPGKNINATAFFNYAYINLPSDQRDMDIILTLMFHESFHIIYDEQSLEFKKQFAGWFARNPSKYSKYAELLFNEAITTALANGYLHRLLTDSLHPKGNWYNNKYIASMAWELYPLTVEYLENKKQVDKQFIDHYIGIIEKKFPEWLVDPNFILADRYIICENKEEYLSILQKFRSRNINEYEDQLSIQNLQKLRSTPITKLIVLTKENIEKFELIKQVFPELNEGKSGAQVSNTYVKFLTDKTYLIIVNATGTPAWQLLSTLQLPSN